MKETRSLVGLLSGGMSGERYLSLRSRENILRALRPLGRYRVFPIDRVERHRWLRYDVDDPEKIVGEYSSLQELLRESEPDCLFNAFHGETEIDGRITGILELSGVPFVGNGYYTCFAGIDKVLSKLLFEKAGIPTPSWFTMDLADFIEFKAQPAALPLPFPLVIKPGASGSSLGVKLVGDMEEFIRGMEEMEGDFFPILAESYCRGRECNIGVAGPFKDSGLFLTSLTEVIFPGKIFDAECKKQGSYRTVPIDVPAALADRMRAAARRIHTIFRATAITRMDFIVDIAREEFTVLEINTHPGLSGCSIFPAQLEETGVRFGDFLSKLIDEKLNSENKK